MVLQILTAACLLIPLLGAGVALWSQGRHRSIARATLLAEFLALLGIAIGPDSLGRVSVIKQWLPMLQGTDEGQPLRGIPFELSWHGALVSMLMGLLATFWLMAPRRGTKGESTDVTTRCSSEVIGSVCVCLLCFLCLVAVTATDLVVIIGSWMAIDVVVALLNGPPKDANERSPFAVLRLIALTLLLGVLWFNLRYHSTDVEGLLSLIANDTRIDAPFVRNGIAIVMSAALAWRAGLFPAVIWVQRLLGSPSETATSEGSDQSDSCDRVAHAWIGTVATVVPAMALVWRLRSLWTISPDAGFLLSALGALTCLTGGIAACLRSGKNSATSSLGNVALWCLVVGLGQCLIGMTSGRSDQIGPVAYFVTFGLPLLAVIASCGSQPTRFKVALWLPVWVLTSGVLGQEASLQFAQETLIARAGENAALVLGFDHSKASLAVCLCGIIGQALVGFALVKAVVEQPKENAASSRHQMTTTTFEWARVAILGVTLCSLALFGLMTRSGDWGDATRRIDLHQFLFSWTAGGPVVNRLLAVGVTWPMGWLGCVVAWIVWSLKPDVGWALARRLEPVLQIVRQGWYFEVVMRKGVVWGLEFASFCAEFFDRCLLGGGREGAWARPASELATFFDASRKAACGYSLLAMGGAALALLIVLMAR